MRRGPHAPKGLLKACSIGLTTTQRYQVNLAISIVEQEDTNLEDNAIVPPPLLHHPKCCGCPT